jgi:hypothetical protein
MLRRIVALGIASLITMFALNGCGKPAEAPKAVSQAPEAKPTDHSGWWCNEHGVPEEICARCNSKLVADFKAKGDWCKKHNRPESQCFICHPEKEAEFAAQYEAKYGKKPPKPEPEEKDAKEKHPEKS